MAPLSDVTKQTVKEKHNPKKSRDYYNVQPYLYRQVENQQGVGIYVDDSHVTYINGNLVTGLPPRADSQGKVWVNKQWIESTASEPKELVISFWNTEFPKTQHSETEKFIWSEGKTSIKVFLPDVYTINTRPLANENDEEQSYQRAYYLVRKGDTWTKLEIELGSNTVEALMLHNRMSYEDQLVEGTKLYYPLGFRTRNEVGSNTGKKPSEKKEERKEEKKAQPSIAKKEPENNKQRITEERSSENGKPVDRIEKENEELVCKHCGKSLVLTKEFIEKIIDKKDKLKVSQEFISSLVLASKTLFKKYKLDSCRQLIHLLAQAKQETGGYKNFRESLYYKRETYSAEAVYKLSPTVINQGFERKGLGKYTREQKLEYIDKNLLNNDKNYGKHCYGGVGEYKDNDYRGRGFIHLTHFSTYQDCYNYTGLNVLKYPELLERDYLAAIESALWFWNVYNKIGNMADKDNVSLSNDKLMRELTKIVNKGLHGYSNRVKYRNDIKKYFFDMFGECK